MSEASSPTWPQRNTKPLLAGIFSLIAALTVGFGIYAGKIYSNSKTKLKAKEAKISIEKVIAYEKAGESRYWCMRQFDEEGITPERLEILLEKGVETDYIRKACFSGRNHFWTEYQKFTASGFDIQTSFDYISKDVSLERAIAWKDIKDENLKKLIEYEGLDLEQAKKLLDRGFDPEFILRHHEYNIPPNNLDVVITKNCINSGRGSLKVENNDEYRRWLLAGFNDDEIQFCWGSNHSLENAKKWREADYSVQEMHKYKKLPELLEQK